MNPFDLEQWRKLFRDFDAQRVRFITALTEMRSRVAPTAELEGERQALLKKAGPVESAVNTFLAGTKAVRDMLKSIGFGETPQTQMGILPIIGIGLSLGGAAVIVGQITSWLKAADAYKAKLAIATAVKDAGGSGRDISDAINASVPREQPKLFGMDMGALKWVAILGGIILAGPVILKEIQKRT